MGIMKRTILDGLELCAMIMLLAGCNKTIDSPLSDMNLDGLHSQFTNDISSLASLTGASLFETSFSTTYLEGDLVENNYKLIVKGKEIHTKYFIDFNDELKYAELPLTTIMQELGATIIWQDDSWAQIWLNGEEYCLNATAGIMNKAGETVIVLSVAPGSRHGSIYRAVDGEFIIDSDSAKLLIVNIVGATMRVDAVERIVYIN